MRTQRNYISTGNAAYQRQFARVLIGSLGYEGAVDACHRQGWQGTLGILTRTYNSTKPC